MYLYALRLDEGDDYDVGIYRCARPLNVGAELVYDERRWSIVEENSMRLETPEGVERALQLVCRPAAQQAPNSR